MTQTANATVKYGDVFWITGLAGAGKSTIARALAAELRISANNVVLLDGDAFRSIFTDVGYSPKDRLENAWRIARTSNMLSMQYIHVVAATVSLYDEVRDWLRTSIPTYHEIFVNPSMETLMRRDQKGLYSGAAAGTGAPAGRRGRSRTTPRWRSAVGA